MDEQTDIKYLKGVGEKRARLCKKLGISSIGDLLHFYPRNYYDWSKVVPIAQSIVGDTCCIKAIVSYPPSEHRIRSGLTLYKTSVTDGFSIMEIVIFNNKYAAQKLKEGEEYLFLGKVDISRYGHRVMNSPDIEVAQDGERIRPIYHQTEGLNSKFIEGCVKRALEGMENNVKENLPEPILQKYRLCSLQYALQSIHFPSSEGAIKAAKRRLIFEELFTLQLGLLRFKGRSLSSTSATIKKDFSEEFFSLLPFSPTNAQRRTIKEALYDMMGTTPMSRLLQGDVGSGKTVVAAALIYSMAKNGFQSAIMAPTEILAEQHYRTLSSILKTTPIKIALLTGAATAAVKRDIKTRLKNGELDLIIGTHALIQNDVEFAKLGFVVTDEQHRFGVAQRAALSEKGNNPHILVMSATPIPRTLALIIYGDLDVSVLDELPAGRQPVKTYQVTSDYRQRIYKYIKKKLDVGLQAYIVCPLVEEGETELVAAQEYAQMLADGEFNSYRVGLLHGRMKDKQKEAVMHSFVEGETQLLVSTTVIEVGVDVPNAVVMVIENAERFGLSQLHQLRGRVGRGAEESTCILISDAQNETALERFEIMCKTTDGFKIADKDLELRGPGDFFGSRQHGLPALKIANMLTDMEILRAAQNEARLIMEKDPFLASVENQGLAQAVKKLFEDVREAGLN